MSPSKAAQRIVNFSLSATSSHKEAASAVISASVAMARSLGLDAEDLIDIVRAAYAEADKLITLQGTKP